MKIIVLGFGPIGRAAAKSIVDAKDLSLAGVVDPAPRIAGRDVGTLIGRKEVRGLIVARDLGELRRRGVKAVVHASGSRFPDELPLLQDLVEAGLDVVSTCEELVAARVRWPAKARALDRAARRQDRRVLLGGINPGYLMDVLPVSLASVCTTVRSLRVTRYVDTGARRRALQIKTGAGLPVAEFRRRARNGAIGHVGLTDSMLYIVDRLGLAADDIRETIRPIVATREVRKGSLVVPAGRTAGQHQVVRARNAQGKTVAVLDLKMAAGLVDPRDEIRISGTPPIDMRVEGGVHGDTGTVGRFLAQLRQLRQEPPGFHL